MEELKRRAHVLQTSFTIRHLPTPPAGASFVQFFQHSWKKEKNIYIYICALFYLFQKHLLLVPAPTTCWRTDGSLSRPNQTTLLWRPHTKHTLQHSRCSTSQAEQTPFALIQTTTFSLTRTVYVLLMCRFRVMSVQTPNAPLPTNTNTDPHYQSPPTHTHTHIYNVLRWVTLLWQTWVEICCSFFFVVLHYLIALLYVQISCLC